jgi:hypothetical protein
MNKEFCEKTIEVIESLGKKIELLEQASRITSDMMNNLNERTKVQDKEIVKLKYSKTYNKEVLLNTKEITDENNDI